jgi:hypothetical protein
MTAEISALKAALTGAEQHGSAIFQMANLLIGAKDEVPDAERDRMLKAVHEALVGYRELSLQLLTAIERYVIAAGGTVRRDDANPPPDEPRGILFLLDPRYAELIPAEDEFQKKIDKAYQEGRLWFEASPPNLH